MIGRAGGLRRNFIARRFVVARRRRAPLDRPGGLSYNTRLRPFVPLFKNPHLQTVAGRYWPRPAHARRFPVERKLYRTEPDVQVLVEAQRPAGPLRGRIVMVHGLEGSANAAYMHGLAGTALADGYAAHRVNLRTCGGTECYSKTVYHGGLTTDVLAILRALAAEDRTPLWLVGFSLGGNVVAKLAGELGENARPLLAGVVAASAAIDLEACAIRVGQPENRVYQTRFLSLMRARARLMWHTPRAELRGIRSVIEMDDRITAPHIGFRNALHYYHTQSANQFLEHIRVPTLFIAAQDDPLGPLCHLRSPGFQPKPMPATACHALRRPSGPSRQGRPRLWLDHAIMKWIAEVGTNHPPHSSEY